MGLMLKAYGAVYSLHVETKLACVWSLLNRTFPRNSISVVLGSITYVVNHYTMGQFRYICRIKMGKTNVSLERTMT